MAGRSFKLIDTYFSEVAKLAGLAEVAATAAQCTNESLSFSIIKPLSFEKQGKIL